MSLQAGTATAPPSQVRKSRQRSPRGGPGARPGAQSPSVGKRKQKERDVRPEAWRFPRGRSAKRKGGGQEAAAAGGAAAWAPTGPAPALPGGEAVPSLSAPPSHRGSPPAASSRGCRAQRTVAQPRSAAVLVIFDATGTTLDTAHGIAPRPVRRDLTDRKLGHREVDTRPRPHSTGRQSPARPGGVFRPRSGGETTHVPAAVSWLLCARETGGRRQWGDRSPRASGP